MTASPPPADASGDARAPTPPPTPPPEPEAPRTTLWHLADFCAAVLYGVVAAGVATVGLGVGVAAFGMVGLAAGPIVLAGMLLSYRGLGSPRRPTDGSLAAPLGIGVSVVVGLYFMVPDFEGESRKGSNEAAAIGALRTLTTAQALYREGDKNKDTVFDYCTVLGPQNVTNSLANVGLIDERFGSGTKQGYKFTIVTADNFTWSATANPVSPTRSGDRYFFVDESGVIRFGTLRSGTSLDKEIGG